MTPINPITEGSHGELINTWCTAAGEVVDTATGKPLVALSARTCGDFRGWAGREQVIEHHVSSIRPTSLFRANGSASASRNATRTPRIRRNGGRDQFGGASPDVSFTFVRELSVHGKRWR